VAAPRREIVFPRAAYSVGAILLGGYTVYWLRDEWHRKIAEPGSGKK
jgi:hypothetical protein